MGATGVAAADTALEFTGTRYAVLHPTRIDLAADGVDLAIRIGNPGQHADLTARHLGSQPLLMCASPALVGQVPLISHLDNLSTYPHLTLLEQGRSQPWLLKNQQDELLHWMPDDRLRLSTMSTVYAACH